MEDCIEKNNNVLMVRIFLNVKTNHYGTKDQRAGIQTTKTYGI